MVNSSKVHKYMTYRGKSRNVLANQASQNAASAATMVLRKFTESLLTK